MKEMTEQCREKNGLLQDIQRDYEKMEVEKKCRNLIAVVMPDIEHIRCSLAKEYERPVIQYVTARVKTPESIMNKLIRKQRKVTLQKAVETFNDLAGIRVVCSFQDDVYRVKKIIEKLPELQVEKVKDYIANPKPTGYRSIHIIATVPNVNESSLDSPQGKLPRESEITRGDFPLILSQSDSDPIENQETGLKFERQIKLEIQICSAAMNYWAMLEHQLSYKNSKIDEVEYERIQAKLKSYAFQIADIDKRFLRVRKKIEKL